MTGLGKKKEIHKWIHFNSYPHLTPSHSRGRPEWQQNQRPGWRWGRCHGSRGSAPAELQHHSQTSGTRRRSLRHTVQMYLLNTLTFQRCFSFFLTLSEASEVENPVKSCLCTDGSRKTSERVMKLHGGPAFCPYPGCVSLTPQVMCIMATLWVGRLMPTTVQTPLRRPAPTTKGDLDCQQSERSPGINRSVTAGEQNNKWPRCLSVAGLLWYFCCLWVPMRNRETPGCFARSESRILL